MAKKTAVKEVRIYANTSKSIALPEEHLSYWFIAGLKEFGITKEQYHKMSQREKNTVKKSLAEFGHF